MKNLEIQSVDKKEATAIIKDYTIKYSSHGQWKITFDLYLNGELASKSFHHTDASAIDELNEMPYNNRLEFIFLKYEHEITECLKEMLYFQD